jgi:hypothetical protein
MGRFMRARVLLAEAAALGVTIEDLVAESSVSPKSLSRAPTVRQYVEIVSPPFSKGTAGTYWSYWRLAIDQLGERTMDSIGVDDCESIVTAAEERARHNRPGTDGRSARENCIGALVLLFSGPSAQDSSHEVRPLIWRSRAAYPIDVRLSKTTSCAKL